MKETVFWGIYTRMYPFLTIFRFLINRTVVHVVLLMKLILSNEEVRLARTLRLTTINRNQIKILMAFAWAFEMASRISGDPQESKVYEQAVC